MMRSIFLSDDSILFVMYYADILSLHILLFYIILSRVFRFLGIIFLAASSLALIKWSYVAVILLFMDVVISCSYKWLTCLPY